MTFGVDLFIKIWSVLLANGSVAQLVDTESESQNYTLFVNYLGHSQIRGLGSGEIREICDISWIICTQVG